MDLKSLNSEEVYNRFVLAYKINLDFEKNVGFLFFLMTGYNKNNIFVVVTYI
ncbi:hypothetical protein SAMN05444401_0111 [Clostridium amylolyticum]|uniref:Uncharacterized protein n=1 Tax=Clostridium amylolyticum TaxID=1121298 RepID=A0A1M6N6M1_9CLOT|nr:hypothetical protein SAMN05444401_0111 [Clostridium amylolyticum]